MEKRELSDLHPDLLPDYPRIDLRLRTLYGSVSFDVAVNEALDMCRELVDVANSDLFKKLDSLVETQYD